MFKLERLSNKPVLEPDKTNAWERAAVFNCAAAYRDGLFHLFYRASDKPFYFQTQTPEEQYKYVSSIGYAYGKDGIHFSRMKNPLITGTGAQEAWGPEDPRITKINGKFYMVYTGFGGRSWDDFRICMRESADLKTWGSPRILLDEPNKDAALLPEKINGNYFLFHRRMPSIWGAVSDDLIHWHSHREILKPRPGKWDCVKVGLAGTPVELEDGWLAIYHGVDSGNCYRLGAMLLDKHDPFKITAIQDEPILEPLLDWEVNGLVPNVVFSCASLIVDGFLYVYYGGADTVIGAAGISVGKIRF